MKDKNFTVIYAYPETGSAKITVCVKGGGRDTAQAAADQILAEWGLDKKTRFVGIQENEK